MMFGERDSERNEGYFQDRLNEEQLLDEMKSNKRSFLWISIKNSLSYENVMEKLNMLIVKLDEPIYEKTDNTGEKLRKIRNIYDLILMYYSDLVDTCDDYLRTHSGIRWTSSGEERRSLIFEIREQAIYERRCLCLLGWKKVQEMYGYLSGITFKEILKDLRTEVIDITDRNDIENFGGNTSSGASIGDGEDKRFFKPKEVVYGLPKNENLIDFFKYKCLIKNSKEIKAFEYVLSNEGLLNLDFLKDRDMIRNNFEITLDNVKDIFSRFNVQYSTDEEGDIIINGFKLTPESLYRLSCIIRKYYRIIFLNDLAVRVVGIPSGARIDIRNVATSRLFRALGSPDIVVESHLAVLRKEGVPDKEGIIMAKATGKSSQQLSKDLRFFTEQSVMGQGIYQIRLSKDVQRKFANLQLGDYIAGQTDRHRENYFVDYKILDMGTGAGAVEFYITSIQGIDNDMSFGVLDGQDVLSRVGCLPRFLGKLGALSLPFIDRGIADRLQELSDPSIEYIFADLLSSKEMEALKDRFYYLQTAISCLYNETHKLDSDGWNQTSLDATLASDNYLSRFIKYVRKFIGSDVPIVSD